MVNDGILDLFPTYNKYSFGCLQQVKSLLMSGDYVQETA
jgi:hypothetical protein